MHSRQSAFPIRAILLALALVLLPSLSAEASILAPQAVDDRILVFLNEPGGGTTIQFSTLIENDNNVGQTASIVIAKEPQYRAAGSGVSGDTYFFVPTESFWALGTDQLTYTVTVGGSQSTATALLIAYRPPAQVLIEADFEPSDPIDWVPFAGTNRVELSTVTPISGAASLEIDIPSAAAGSAFAAFEFRGDDDDEGELGGCYRAGNQGGTAPFESEAEAWILVLQQGALNPATAPVRVRRQPDGALIVEVLDASNVHQASAPIYPINEVVHFRLSWSQREGRRQALLRVDGQAVMTPRVLHNPATVDTAYVGGVLVDGDPNTGLELQFDLLRGYRSNFATDSTTNGFFSSGLESGDLSDWTQVFGGIQASQGSAQSGDNGLESQVDAANFVVRTFDHGKNGATFRLTMDTTGFSLQHGRLLVAARGGSGSDPLFAQADFGLHLLGFSGGLRAGVSTFYTGSTVHSPYSPIDDQSVVELQYRRSDPGAHNGYVRLWIDGVVKAHHGDLPDGRLCINGYPRGCEPGPLALGWIRVGASGFNVQYATGALGFDEISVARTE
ncbi:MAG: hypothetical protein AAF657_03475 [Acidobacteriota bacterium]